MTIDKTLSEREQRYGDFTDVAVTAQALQDTMRAAPGWDRLDPVQRQGLTAIADKIARILSGDPNYPDNWHDIAGYATIVEQRLPGARPAISASLPPGFTACDGGRPADAAEQRQSVIDAMCIDANEMITEEAAGLLHDAGYRK